MLHFGGSGVAVAEAAREWPTHGGIFSLEHAVSRGSTSNSSLTDTTSMADTLDCGEDEEQELDSPPAWARAPEAAAAARARPERGGCAKRWRVVWCHERVHRQECAAQRKAIGEAARRAKAGLTCIKKASKFAAWLPQAQRPLYVLLTDWREVKPCLQAAATLPNPQRPAFTVVVAEEEHLYNRACCWLSTLPPDMEPVHVCRDTSILSSFLDNLAAAFAAGGAGELSSAGHSKQNRQCAVQALRSVLQEVTEEEGLQAARSVEAAQRRRSEERTEKVSTPSTSEGRSDEALQEPVGASPSAHLEQEHPDTPTLPPRLADPILAPGLQQQKQQASRWRPQHSSVVDFAVPISLVLSLCHPRLLEQILREAMPERYED